MDQPNGTVRDVHINQISIAYKAKYKILGNKIKPIRHPLPITIGFRPAGLDNNSMISRIYFNEEGVITIQLSRNCHFQPMVAIPSEFSIITSYMKNLPVSRTRHCWISNMFDTRISSKILNINREEQQGNISDAVNFD